MAGTTIHPDLDRSSRCHGIVYVLYARPGGKAWHRAGRWCSRCHAFWPDD